MGEFISPTASVCAPGSGKAIAQSKGVHREVESEDKTLSYDVTYDTSNSARHGFLNFHFAVRRAIYAPVFLLCSAVIFFCTSFQVSLSTIAGWEFST